MYFRGTKRKFLIEQFEIEHETEEKEESVLCRQTRHNRVRNRSTQYVKEIDGERCTHTHEQIDKSTHNLYGLEPKTGRVLTAYFYVESYVARRAAPLEAGTADSIRE